MAKSPNFADEIWNKGPKETSTFAYYLKNEIYLNYFAVSQFSLKELKQTIVHEVIHAKLDVVEKLGDEDDNDPKIPDDFGHGKICYLDLRYHQESQHMQMHLEAWF